MAPTAECWLEPIDLHDADHFRELQRQRILCTWDYDTDTLQTWRQQQDENVKRMFWIMTTNRPSSSDGNEKVRAGHISLASKVTSLYPPETQHLPHVDDKLVLCVQTFFILPEYRSGGLGRKAMQKIEEAAVQELYGSPNCRFIALNAMSKRHFYQEGREWNGVFARLGQSMPSFSIQEWYEAQGYVSWKEEQLYEEEVNGDVVKLWEVFMRKEISR